VASIERIATSPPCAAHDAERGLLLAYDQRRSMSGERPHEEIVGHREAVEDDHAHRRRGRRVARRIPCAALVAVRRPSRHAGLPRGRGGWVTDLPAASEV